ncbi:hypothetical protein HanPI659440_Chr12g0446471 [Helianthus annuus]|nr:hypothetical protein HanPI659440_Chr12g0446471 [Helianthus annuus]
MMGLTRPVGVVRQMANEYRLFLRRLKKMGMIIFFESSHIKL